MQEATKNKAFFKTLQIMFNKNKWQGFTEAMEAPMKMTQKQNFFLKKKGEKFQNLMWREKEKNEESRYKIHTLGTT